MKIGLKPGTVKLEKYNPNWISLYNEEADALNITLKEYNVKIYHVGSTAIPFMDSKPIIDILIVIPDYYYKETIQKMKDCKYHKCSFEPKGEILFKKGDDTISTHYYHLFQQSGEWQDYLVFVKYLSCNKEEFENYQNLKRELGKKYSNNRPEYTSQKQEFVKRIFDKAKREKFQI